MAAKDVPVEVEDRLPRARTDVDEHAIVGETRVAGGLRDEVEHPFGLVGGELGDVAEALDVTLRQDEQMGLGLRVDVANSDETVRPRDMVALADEPAEEAVLRQRRSPPP
jgi:hypothetical protein